ncbi:hypothetical protein L1S34_14550 [Flavobacterium sp. K77]|uniref:hypothetical protein n=1 Tax=Flavobacterium sp. K77 TaxID=2910676 RepID=UPI001F25EEE0|nr:hypothetical protein [Flavobacterium sp. K77]MCF6142509.1 hypothetical protein [Flavobacterium sp. K77]
MKNFLFYFALTGWTLGVTVHLLSLGDIDVTENASFFILLLSIGIFVVWIPVVLDLRNNEELKEYQESSLANRMNTIGFYKIVFKETPTWMSSIAIGGLVYAFINFMLFLSSQDGTPDIKDGQYLLQNHGQLIKTLTLQEYHHYKANEIRGFSGHLIAFYGVATAVLFKFSGLRTEAETI